MRNDAVPAPTAAPAARMSIARRPLFDLPIAANGGGAAMALSSSSSSGAPVAGSGSAAGNPGDSDAIRPAETIVDASADPDFDLSSTFDIPAFLRRQEG
jgi:hypothetical protein